jgi:hypothetical protein
MVPITNEKFKGHIQRLDISDGSALGRTTLPGVTSFELYCTRIPKILNFVVGVATITL